LHLVPPLPPNLSFFPYTTLFRSTPSSSDILYQLYYLNPAGSYALIPNSILQVRNPQMDNGSTTNGTSTPPIDISGVEVPLVVERSEEHTSNSSHVAISYAVFCLK